MTKKTKTKIEPPPPPPEEECDHYWEKKGNTMFCYRCGAVRTL